MIIQFPKAYNWRMEISTGVDRATGQAEYLLELVESDNERTIVGSYSTLSEATRALDEWTVGAA